MEDLFGIKTDTAKRASVPKIGEPSGMASEKMQPASLDYAKLPTATTQQPSSLTSVQGRKTEPAPSKPVSTAPSNKPTTPQKKEISFDDSDLLADLGFDPKKPKSKSTILDDILGGPLTAATKEIPPKSIMAKPRQSLTTTLEEPQTTSKAVSRQSTDTSENPPPESSVMGSYAPTGNNLPSFGAAPKRSGRRKSSVSMLNDPLGLFGGTTEEKGSRAEMKQPKKGGADWLGLNDDPVASEVEQVPVPSTTLAKPRDSIAVKAPPVAPVPPDVSAEQQRINANIQLIMSQPAPFASLPFGDRTTSELSPNDLRQATEPNATEKVELQTDVKRLEMEKLRLEDMVANLSANHEQELSILESSYKKQMTFLEESLRIMEARLKHDNKQLEDFYQAKITFVEQEKQKLIADHEAKAQSMEEHHRKVIEQLKQGYEESLEQLRQDHRESVAAIRESKMLEFSAIQDNQSYLQTLKSASSYLENASGDLQQLRDTLQDQIEFTQKEKELQLKQREKQLEDQQRLLDRTREATAEENVRLLNLVEMLESKVTEMTKISSQERWEYQQKCVKLEAERQSVDKEKQFLRERHEREEKRIDELKRSQLEEHSRLMDKVAQERQTLLEEKAKLETMAQLASTTNSIGTGTSRLEVEAALKVAEEAARQADSEKERYLQMQRQLESKRREMQTRESKLCEAKDELEAAIDRACQRERNAETVYRSLRKSEQNLQLKMQLIQRQFREVSEREDRLAKEKIEFSKERLELQAARRKLLQTRCSLCKIGDKSQEIAGDLLTTNTDSVADDLKLEANFAEMQNRLDVAGLRLDQHFDSDVDRQMKLFLERNQTDQCDDVELTESQRRHREIDRDLALLNFDALFPHLRSGEET
uniref:Fas-binding factor 1 C-terminal domain-containing protein n=1 Tax=Anopheles coluzzii TaxID=1518534 RepID=A0A8W7PZS8_ANOCL